MRWSGRRADYLRPNPMRIEKKLSKTFHEFMQSGKAGGIVLILCTLVSLALANSALGPAYLGFWHGYVAGLSIEHWVNDALMAVFFLLIGLELKRELYNGELSDLRNAMLPILGAVGGIAVPALIHFLFNGGSATQAGIGIPMATDIAFALGVLSLLGNRVPASLKVFLAALAVMDDLGAIIVIAVFYTTQLSFAWLFAALGVFAALFLMQRVLRVMVLLPYLLGGALMWYCMLQSGVHATIAGVLLAFAIPYSAVEDDADSPSRPGRRKASRHRARHLRRGGARRVPPAARPGLAPHPGRRPAGRHRLHDVDLHYQSRLCRPGRDDQCLEDGDPAGLVRCRGDRLRLAEIHGCAAGIRPRSGYHGLRERTGALTEAANAA